MTATIKVELNAIFCDMALAKQSRRSDVGSRIVNCDFVFGGARLVSPSEDKGLGQARTVCARHAKKCSSVMSHQELFVIEASRQLRKYATNLEDHRKVSPSCPKQVASAGLLSL